MLRSARGKTVSAQVPPSEEKTSGQTSGRSHAVDSSGGQVGGFGRGGGGKDARAVRSARLFAGRPQAERPEPCNKRPVSHRSMPPRPPQAWSSAARPMDLFRFGFFGGRFHLFFPLASHFVPMLLAAQIGRFPPTTALRYGMISWPEDARS